MSDDVKLQRLRERSTLIDEKKLQRLREQSTLLDGMASKRTFDDLPDDTPAVRAHKLQLRNTKMWTDVAITSLTGIIACKRAMQDASQPAKATAPEAAAPKAAAKTSDP